MKKSKKLNIFEKLRSTISTQKRVGNGLKSILLILLLLFAEQVSTLFMKNECKNATVTASDGSQNTLNAVDGGFPNNHDCNGINDCARIAVEDNIAWITVDLG